MAFMDKFGPGEGFLAKLTENTFGKQNRIDRKAARRDAATPGSGKYNRLQNQINRLSGVGGGMMDDNFLNPLGTQSDFQRSKFKTTDKSAGGYGEFDFSKFDVTNPADVAAVQKELGLVEDGIFGPETEKAYRNMVNMQRESKGLMGYTYGDTPEDTDVLMDAMGVEDVYGPEEDDDDDVYMPIGPGSALGNRFKRY
jgi:hypothetical protein